MKFKFDEFVWAKLKGFSPWPGKIMFGHSSDPPSKKKEYKYVYFFGSHNHAWVPVDKLYKYVPHRRLFSKKLSTKVFKSAVHYIACEHNGLLALKADKDSGYPISESEDESEEEAAPRNKRRSRTANKNRILKKKFGNRSNEFTTYQGVFVLHSEVKQLKKLSVKVEKMQQPKTSVDTVDILSKSQSSHTATCTSVQPIKIQQSQTSVDTVECISKSQSSHTATCTSVQPIPGSSKMPSSVQGVDPSFFRLSPEISITPLTCAEINSFQPLKLPEVNTKKIDIQSKSIENAINLHHNIKVSAASAKIEPNQLPSISIIPLNSLQVKVSKVEKKCVRKLGFIGLGRVGQNMVKTLLCNGHIVNVWSRSNNKYGDVIKEGAFRKNSPAEIIRSSDIIFCCLSSADDLNEVLYGKEGVLAGFRDVKECQKIYIDLTTTDTITMKIIKQILYTFGALFFEAAVLGKMIGVDCTSLIFLCAGNRGVFEKIQIYLENITKSVHYFGTEFGATSEKNMTYYAIQGILFSALTKFMNRINKEKFDLRNLKGIIQAMYDDETIIDIPLHNVNRHFIAALSVDNKTRRPLPCDSVSHYASKRAKHVHFEDDDDDVIIIE